MSSETIEIDDAEIDEVRTFVICGAQIDTHFDIGIGPASDDEATIEALPAPVYDAVREHVLTVLDVDSLHDVTTTERSRLRRLAGLALGVQSQFGYPDVYM